MPDSLWSRPEVLVALDRRNIAGLLVLIRRYAGCSQNDLAGVTGIAQGRISEYTRGLRLPTLDTIERIADGWTCRRTAVADSDWLHNAADRPRVPRSDTEIGALLELVASTRKIERLLTGTPGRAVEARTWSPDL